MQWEKLIKISRPRFWMYTFGPFLIGWIAGIVYQLDSAAGLWLWWSVVRSWEALPMILSIYLSPVMFFLLLIAADYFLFSANLWIYGVNDIADGDTDQLNNKKWDYEHKLEDNQKSRLSRMVFLLNSIEWWLLLVLLIVVEKFVYYNTQRRWWAWALVMFWLTAYFYSALPIRAKAKPFVDGIFNVLYILPSMVWWIVAGNSIVWFSRAGFIAAWLWAMAMHAYSAIPDIEPDREAGLTTTAVLLGKQGTLIYCGLLRAVAAYIAYTILWLPMLLMWAVYLLMIIASFGGEVMKLYRRFPWINAGVGFILFWVIVLG